MRVNYSPLTEHLDHLFSDGNHRWVTSFSEIEEVLQTSLPNSAHRHRPFWANTSQGASRAWVSIGWKTQDVNMNRKTLTFLYKDEETDTKKSSNKMPTNISVSSRGYTFGIPPMENSDVVTKKDRKTFGDNLNKKMDIQKKDMDTQKKDMDIQKKDMDTQKKNMDIQKKNMDIQKKDMDTQKKDMDTQKKNMDIQKKNMKQSIIKYLIVASVCFLVVIALLEYI